MTQQQSRRERRAEARRTAARRPANRPAKSRLALSPVALASIAAVLVGVVVIGFIALQGSSGSVATLRAPTTTTPPALAHGRSLGDDAAPVKIDVYSDFQCPNCLRFWDTVLPGLVADDIGTGKAQLIYHDFAFLGPESFAAADGARCADQQDRFWQFHDYVFANQGDENSGALSDARLAQMAAAVGLDTAKWSTCIQDRATDAAVRQETAAGQARGVNGTPTVFVNGSKLPSYDLGTIEAAIKAITG
jgi:protein-disulfide isomerase